MTFSPDNRDEHPRLPGYKRGSRGGTLLLFRKDDGPMIDADAEAESYERCWGTIKAIEYLERDAGDKRFKHHVLRRAADILRAKWVRGEVRS